MEFSTTTLLVRHLPAELTEQDKVDLLRHFGAQTVKPMGTTGPLKHTAFVRFESPELAAKCLHRLHQLEVEGRKLVVEFARSEHKNNVPLEPEIKKATESKDAGNEASNTTGGPLPVVHPDKDVDSSFIKHNIPYPKKPYLRYLYPPPTVSTLTNIANALASQPRFYTQVLHLMNKMNLPCPFGAITSSPPLAMDDPKRSGARVESEVAAGDIQEIEMGGDSSLESEIESENENDGVRLTAAQNAQGQTVVRRSMKRPRKKMKLVQPDMSTMIKPSMVPKPSEVFENVEEPKTKQIMLNLPTNRESIGIVATQGSNANDGSLSAPFISQQGTLLREGEERVPMQGPGVARENSDSGTVTVVGGFGKVDPVNKPTQQAEEVSKPDTNYKIDPEQFVASESLESGRLRPSQFKDFSVFKNYASGECTSRLYIKNLTKQTSEQDLVNLFGSFINWSSSLAYNVFDIRLMKEGRMKGQAFVTLPDEGSALKIVSECNGFILNNKPMVIQFARSAKAKEVDKPVA